RHPPRLRVGEKYDTLCPIRAAGLPLGLHRCRHLGASATSFVRKVWTLSDKGAFFVFLSIDTHGRATRWCSPDASRKVNRHPHTHQRRRPSQETFTCDCFNARDAHSKKPHPPSTFKNCWASNHPRR